MVLSRTFISALALAGALAAPCVSHAWFWDGYKIKEFADADDRADIGNDQSADYYKIGSLTGFVAGVYDTVAGSLVCTPGQVNLGQMVGIVKKYVRENPDKWDRPASTLVIKALSSAFPCNKK